MIALISPAYAEGGAPADAGIFNIVLLVGFVIIFYFLMWRPQAKRAKEHRNLIASLAKGTEVVTSGGILGKVTKVDDNYIVLEVSDEVEMKFQKASVTSVLPKGTLKSI
ncbi:preprotein translocase subunit YajC [Marinomonas mediterranea]|jgi:protein translocase subunit yajC|uniref:Sec translocon accessory complex subunit YajC n=1 Tax=Marinomonas mediterranea (strain ATCC 700492 / JCM 21426 / NBRC 103028 / MMB-1) TaxID=717774 RepID=F2JYV2_MARM1|nr:preprotein translocase subunit YajC [Marinomonas mediterranea]ADZ90817.1 preprotein translocase, YajC subunit [Marinomonas mediterranea MMB-1]WCN08856.1 preprotein translocase subunit YajC [Marinomonas mediterranea]WCN12900.1 preprotein translocase subunit YajC [Marinomonas mediterranea]WCN16969.1 preprotein translocase subunit YajC [Marinomonas mediterranea MMB-1]